MKVLLASSVHSATRKELEARHDVVGAINGSKELLQEKIVDREVLVFRSGVQIDADVMECAPDLKLIIRGGSGFDNIDMDYVRRRGLDMVRLPGPGAKAVSEMAFGLMLALARNIVPADCLLREGRWTKQQMTGFQLRGKTLGIVGAGNIGCCTADLGVAWGMHVLGCVEDPTADDVRRLAERGVQVAPFEELLTKSDFVCLHVPLTPSTRNLIDDRALGLMKPEAFLVNLARGGVVDEAALLKALTDSRIRGAALDVHEQEGEGKISPLAHLPNVVLTPHIGAGTFDSQREIGDMVLEIIDGLAEGRPMAAEMVHTEGVVVVGEYS